MKLQIGMNTKERELVCYALSKVLASTYVLYLKTQNFHWNYKGVEFYGFHLLFEKQYEELADAVDEIAERIRALGLNVDATMDVFKKNSSVKEKKGIATGNEIVLQLVHDHEIVIQEWRALSLIAEKTNDGASIDLAGRRLGAHEKFAWMLRSSLTSVSAS